MAQPSNATYAEDYARILALMQDKTTIVACLDGLEHEINHNPVSAGPDVNWFRLSSILSYYEKKCGFPADVLLPMGILSEDDFYFYIRLGYVLKDYGAGVKHGEFTHRLQWHVIMRVVTDDFTTARRAGWHCSPFQLYTRLGYPDAKGVWAFLIDRQGAYPGGHWPDTFHSWTLAGSGKLAGMLKKRETKRRIEFVQAMTSYLADRKHTHGLSITVPSSFSISDPHRQTHEQFLEFDAWLQKELIANRLKPEDVFSKVSNDLVPAYRARKEVPSSSIHKKQKRDVPYVKLSTGAVYNLSGNPIWTEQDATTRAAESATKLF